MSHGSAEAPPWIIGGPAVLEVRAEGRAVGSRLEFYHDYGASPLWQLDPSEVNVALDSLPLPADLQRRLDAWAREVGAVLGRHRYAWPDAVTREALRSRGQRLCAETRRALAPDYEVVCDRDPLRG